MAVHHIKFAGGMRYVDGLMRLGVAHTKSNCSKYSLPGAFRECWTSEDLNCKPTRSYRATTPLGWRAGGRGAKRIGRIR